MRLSPRTPVAGGARDEEPPRGPVRFDGARLVALVDGTAVPLPDDGDAALVLLSALYRRALLDGTADLPEPWLLPPDPPAFLAAVEEALVPAEGTPLHERLLETYLSIDRFLRWGHVLDDEVGLGGARVLVSGCGPGGSMKAYTLLGARATIGTEVDGRLARLAGLRLRDWPTALPLLFDGGRLPLADAAVDLVESIDVIEHVPDADAYLAEHARVLAPGGAMLVVTPNRLYPVEQHLDIAGAPWLPLGAANRLFARLAELERMPEDRRYRWRNLATVRTQNISFARLRALAKRHGLFLQQLDPARHEGHWPLPRPPAPLERWSATRLGKFAAPVRTLAVLLHKPGKPLSRLASEADHRRRDG